MKYFKLVQFSSPVEGMDPAMSPPSNETFDILDSISSPSTVSRGTRPLPKKKKKKTEEENKTKKQEKKMKKARLTEAVIATTMPPRLTHLNRRGVIAKK